MILSNVATSKRAQATLALLIVLLAVHAWERSGDGKLGIIEVAEEEVADNYSSDVTALQFDESGNLIATQVVSDGSNNGQQNSAHIHVSY